MEKKADVVLAEIYKQLREEYSMIGEEFRRENIEPVEEGTCCLCGKKYVHYGNNPYPLCHKADYVSRCCDKCNMEKVAPAQLSGITYKQYLTSTLLAEQPI